ncbi:unnamed protein product [Linum tenue]|uniref:Amino acid transporter transmembrane domain-containing protein n=1 Tax=Linum tenue TaxID=586396 RepID=A0AAV0PER3_9ROSI|nr:unnamed protein product [Linum tenue]
MPMFDQMESSVVTKLKRPCPVWFLGSVAGLMGGIALPITLAYPCFMWLKVRKPTRYSKSWLVNWVLGVFGLALSGALIVAGVYVVIDNGIKFSFFKPT